jgi:hypothetical protein
MTVEPPRRGPGDSPPGLDRDGDGLALDALRGIGVVDGVRVFGGGPLALARGRASEEGGRNPRALLKEE